jgi:hypothetical protein
MLTCKAYIRHTEHDLEPLLGRYCTQNTRDGTNAEARLPFNNLTCLCSDGLHRVFTTV